MIEIPFADFSPTEYKTRVSQASKLMEVQCLDAMVLTSQENIRYFAGGPIIDLYEDHHNFFFLVLPQDPSIEPALIMSTGREGACSTSWIRDRRFWGYEGGSLMGMKSAFKLVKETFNDKGLNKGVLGMELDSGMRLGMTYAEFQAFKEVLTDAKIFSATEIISNVRSVKSVAEIEKIRKACKITCTAFQKGFESLKVGMSERDLASIIRSTMFEKGATGQGILSVISGEERMIWANALASDRRIQKGDLVMADGGCYFDGYISDISRMASMGQPTNRVKELVSITREATRRTVEIIKPGTKISDLCSVGRDYFRSKGAGELLVFGEGQTGHGIGMSIHELPDLRLDSELSLEEGMTLAIEPAITDIPVWSKAKSFFNVENDVLVTRNGYEVLTPTSNDLWIA